MNTTIMDIAKNVGISQSSVSRALNSRTGVSPHKRKSILAEAKRLGYYPNTVARGLVMGVTKTIGLILPDITNPFFPEVARGVEIACREYGYNLILCNSGWNIDQERLCIDKLRNRVDGMIIEPCSANSIPHIEQSGIPSVYLNIVTQNEKADHVYVDNVEAAFNATEHLIQCGYHHIAYAGGEEFSYSNMMRFKGYLKALGHYGNTKRSAHIIHGAFTTTSGYEMARKLLNVSHPPDAIVAVNDIIALGILEYSAEKRLLIPKSLGVIGFDDIYTSGLPQIQLSTISLPKKSLGLEAMKAMVRKLSGEPGGRVDVRLHTGIIMRKTTRYSFND